MTFPTAGRAMLAGLAMVLSGLLLSAMRQRNPTSLHLNAELTTATPEHAGCAASSVSLPPEDALMRLYVDINLTLCPAWAGHTIEIAVKYYPETPSLLKPLWMHQTVSLGNQNTSVDVRLFRLRPNQYYVYSVWLTNASTPSHPSSHAAHVVSRGTFQTSPTGWARFDDGPFVAVSGDVPNFEMGTFAVYPSFVAHDEIRQWFQGLIAVDAEGWVVWMYSLCMLEAWDFLPDYTIAVVARHDGSCSMLTNHQNGISAYNSRSTDEHLYFANSQLQRVAADGMLLSQYISRCTGGPLNYNMLSHECRVDHKSDRFNILTTMYEAEVVANMYVPLKMGPTESLSEHADTFANTVLVSWDHTQTDPSASLSVVYDLRDFVPVTQHHLFETTAWNSVHMECNDVDSRTAIEFHHVSSISLGNDDNYIVASRNLDTIWSLRRDGSGLQWTLSSHDEIESNFTFERDLEKFYQPHSAIQLANGNVLLVDDGTDRQGCTVERTGACFSRAVMYRLDHEHGTVSLVWQFTYPDPITDEDKFLTTSQVDTWNEVGGSAYRLSNGHYLVAFSSVGASDANPRGASQIFELDVDGNRTATSLLEVPTPTANEGKQNGYRFVPWNSISGETSISPHFITTIIDLRSKEVRPDYNMI